MIGVPTYPRTQPMLSMPIESKPVETDVFDPSVQETSQRPFSPQRNWTGAGRLRISATLGGIVCVAAVSGAHVAAPEARGVRSVISPCGTYQAKAGSSPTHCSV